MSSRILRQSEFQSVASMSWPDMGGDPEPEPFPSQPAPPQAPPPPPEETAAQITERLQRRFEQELQRETNKARAEGREQGAKQAAEEYRSALEQAARSASELSALKPRLRREAERDVVQLALAVARRILRREVSVDPGALSGIIQAALGQLQAREVHRLRVNPQDRDAIAALEARYHLPPLHADPSLPRGSLMFDTAQGSLDASLDTQLAEIEKGLFDRLGKA